MIFEEGISDAFGRRQPIIMKTMFRSALLIALVSALAPSVFASDQGFDLPDGGSSAIMLAVAMAGLGALRKFRR